MKKLFFSFLLVIASISQLFIILTDYVLRLMFNVMYFIHDVVSTLKTKIWFMCDKLIVNI